MNADPLPPAGPREPWVFGYGSLMWRPGFDYTAKSPARIVGRRRAFCIASVHHRGTPKRPGLVLGLAPGGSVRGVAFQIAPERWADTLAYLKEREQPTETYREAYLPCRLADGRLRRALVFLSDRRHPQWVGVLSEDVQAERIAGAEGLSGRNLDYLVDLLDHLRAAGAEDAALERILIKVRRLEAQDAGVEAGVAPLPDAEDSAAS